MIGVIASIVCISYIIVHKKRGSKKRMNDEENPHQIQRNEPIHSIPRVVSDFCDLGFYITELPRYSKLPGV